METVPGTLELSLITESLNGNLECQVGYSNCTTEVWWLGLGSCPQCAESPPNGLHMCNSCRDSIVAGAAMHHKKCGFKGIALDFYSAIQPI